jgi:subtilisin-like proprotein convertase family protein
VCGGTPVISGTIAPETPLSVFNGDDSAGTWTLEVTDDASLIGGTLLQWCVTIEYGFPLVS